MWWDQYPDVQDRVFQVVNAEAAELAFDLVFSTIWDAETATKIPEVASCLSTRTDRLTVKNITIGGVEIPEESSADEDEDENDSEVEDN
jgi:phage FluMu gp28-like protein